MRTVEREDDRVVGIHKKVFIMMVVKRKMLTGSMNWKSVQVAVRQLEQGNWKALRWWCQTWMFDIQL